MRLDWRSEPKASAGTQDVYNAVQHFLIRPRMSDVRIIKKYPNRRLYDTAISRYITLEEIRRLVIEGEPFQVVDKRSHEDITRSILLQVISEQEEGGDPIFQTNMLKHIIRFYGDPMQSSISRYLELSMQLFMEKQHGFTEQLRQMLGRAEQPLHTLRDLAEDHVPIWRTVRKEFLRNVGRAKAVTLQPRRKNDQNEP
jgi:polyhydroxyalkanoate synthesis repressor PhaR